MPVLIITGTNYLGSRVKKSSKTVKKKNNLAQLSKNKFFSFDVNIGLFPCGIWNGQPLLELRMDGICVLGASALGIPQSLCLCHGSPAGFKR